ncbi:MAG: GlxA family transcriptional regulator [Gammaproteobacteria bacterium]|nr:GlxA family transcriptional regulator [Gammaproteobacteria bacterium]
MNSPDSKPTRYGFLLMPKYSMIAFSSAVEVLRMANRLSGDTLYEWPIYTLDGEPVPASNGVMLTPDAPIKEAAGLEILFVCSGVRVATVYSEQLRQVLHAFDKRGVNLGGICTGTYLLARAGLMDGYHCTIHWENIAGLRESSPEVLVSQELFEIDRNRYTASGGSAPLDMMLQLIKKQHSGQLAAQISEQFMCDRMRGEFDKQRVPLKLLIGSDQPKLIEAVELMESNLEELINLDDLGKLVGVSRRQLERLFKKYLGCVPRRYYLDLRLKKARQLLLQTASSISDIAIACGFVSASHFSKSYREMFGLSPREERQRQREHL